MSWRRGWVHISAASTALGLLLLPSAAAAQTRIAYATYRDAVSLFTTDPEGVVVRFSDSDNPRVVAGQSRVSALEAALRGRNFTGGVIEFARIVRQRQPDGTVPLEVTTAILVDSEDATKTEFRIEAEPDRRETITVPVTTEPSPLRQSLWTPVAKLLGGTAGEWSTRFNAGDPAAFLSRVRAPGYVTHVRLPGRNEVAVLQNAASMPVPTGSRNASGPAGGRTLTERGESVKPKTSESGAGVPWPLILVGGLASLVGIGIGWWLGQRQRSGPNQLNPETLTAGPVPTGGLDADERALAKRAFETRPEAERHLPFDAWRSQHWQNYPTTVVQTRQLREAYESLHAQVKGAEQQAREAMQRLNAAEEFVRREAEFREQFRAVEGQVAEREAALAVARQQLDAAYRQHQGLQTQIEQLGSELTEKGEEITRLKSERDQEKTTSAKTKKRIDAALGSLRPRLGDLGTLEDVAVAVQRLDDADAAAAEFRRQVTRRVNDALVALGQSPNGNDIAIFAGPLLVLSRELAFREGGHPGPARRAGVENLRVLGIALSERVGEQLAFTQLAGLEADGTLTGVSTADHPRKPMMIRLLQTAADRAQWRLPELTVEIDADGRRITAGAL